MSEETTLKTRIQQLVNVPEGTMLKEGELAVEFKEETTAHPYPLIKIGNGTAAYKDLPYTNKLVIEDTTGIAEEYKTEVAIIKYNNTTESIYIPKVTATADFTADSGTGTKIASINVGDETTEVYIDVNKDYVDDNMVPKTWINASATEDSLKKMFT